MSITVNIYYKGKNCSAKEFVKEMTESGVVDKIRKEEGNEKYEYYFSQKDPETVLLIDRWKDQESLDIHHASPMMEQILKLREKYGLTATAERFDTNSDVPEKDKKFIGK